MGKETKIGLAVVGVLLSVFGGLLVRKLVVWERAMSVASQSVAPSAGAPMAKPEIVVQNEPAPRGEASPFRQPHGEPEREESLDVPGRLGPSPVEAVRLEPVPAERDGAVRQASGESPLDIVPETTDAPAISESLEAPQDAPEEIAAPAEIADSAEPPQAAWRDEDQPHAQPEPPADQPEMTVVRGQYAEPERPSWRGSEQAAAAENGKYTVQPNDTLWTISEKVYGSPRYFKALAEHNRAALTHANRLTVGMAINVPAVSLLEQNYPALCPKQRKSAVVKPRALQASTRPRGAAGGNVYVVEEGDTLFDIARYELGKASRWAEIYDLNRETLGEDFDYLQPGTELVMPSKSQGGDSFTRQPDTGIQR